MALRPLLASAAAALASLALFAACRANDGPPSDTRGVAPDDAGYGLPPTDGGPADEDATAAAHVTYTIPFLPSANGLSDGLSINVSIGGGASHEVMLDTGSEALIVPESALGSAVTRPSPPDIFSYEYTSNGLTFAGEIVFATVTLGVADSYKGGSVSGLPVTVAMPVHVVESASCNAAFPGCVVPPSLDSVGMLGAGFGRDPSVAPTSNALLQIAEVASGAMRAGYIVSDNPPQLTVGVPASTPGFARVALVAGSNGDWLAPSLQGCAAIPALAWSLCGAFLVDTGIDDVLLSLPHDASSPYDGGAIPSGTELDFAVPADASVLASVVTLGATSLATPPAVQFRHPPGEAGAINTGRRLLAAYDYLFDAHSGEVGFRRAVP